MAIISISKGSYSIGSAVAQEVAKRLDYECIARDIVLEASKEFDIPEIKLLRAIEDPPSIFDRIMHSKERYVTLIKAALLRHFRQDNVVYHGLGGHFFLQGVSHALKVRLNSDLEERTAIVEEQESISRKDARKLVEKSDEARRQWGLHLYGHSPEEPALYDTVIQVSKVGVDAAVNLICDLAHRPPYQTTSESQLTINDLALASSIEAMVMEMQPEQHGVDVESNQGAVRVRLSHTPRVRGGTYKNFRNDYAEDLQRRLMERTHRLPAFRTLEVHLAE